MRSRPNLPLFVGLYVLTALAATSPAPAATDLKSDPRLEAKVSLAFADGTLESVVKEVSKQTGVAIAAGQGADDWLSRDLPLALFVKEMPAREVMEHLEELTGFHWTVTGEGDQRAYRIWQDLKARQMQADLRDSRLREERSERTRRGLRNIESMARLSRVTPQELEALAEKDPAAFFFATQPGFRELPKILGSLSLEQQLQSTTREGVRLPYKEMPPAMQESVRGMVTGYTDMLKKLVPQLAQLPNREPEWDKATVVIEAPAYDQLAAMGPFSPQTGEVKVEGMGGLPVTLPVFDTSSEFGKIIGEVFSQMSQGVPVVNLQVQVQQQFAKMVAKGVGEKPEPPTDPDLLKKVKFEVEGWSSLGQQLEALHKATGLNLIADNLPQPQMQGPTLSSAVGQEAPVYEILHRMSLLFGLEHEKIGETLRLRDRDWPKKRDWVVPRALVVKWREKAASEDGLAIGDAVEMAQLTEPQSKYGLLAEPRLLVYSVLVDQNRGALRALGTLTPDQLKRLEAGEKLTLEALDQEQREAFQTAWEEKHKGGDEQERSLVPGTVISAETPRGSGAADAEAGKPLLERHLLLLRVEKPGAPPAAEGAVAGPDGPNRTTWPIAIRKVTGVPGLPDEPPAKPKAAEPGRPPAGAPSTK